MIILGGVALEEWASSWTKNLVEDHWLLAVLLVALIGSGLHGIVLGRWQWRILRHRVPDLPRRRWVMATFVPAFAVWLLAIAPGAVDLMAQGGDTFDVFRDGFSQALVLGPLIGLSQMTALRGETTRWKWWFAANVTTYLLGAAMWDFGGWLLDALSLSGEVTPAFPLLAFAVHGTWMLWVTAPQAAAHASRRPDGGSAVLTGPPAPPQA